MADVILLGNGDKSWDTVQSDDYLQVERFQATKTGTLKSIRVYTVGMDDIPVKVAIYADSSGSPGALLASAGETLCDAGWNTVAVSDVSITSGAYYWLAHIQKGGGYGMVRAYSSGGVAKYKYTAYSGFSFPNPAGTGWTDDTWTYALAGWGEESATGSIIPILNQYRQRRT